MAKYILRTSIVAAGTLTLKLAIAQNVDDTMFDGLMQSAPRRAAQVEWHKIPQNEIACINRGLRQQGASVYDLINRGILPFDSQILELRSICSRLPSAADVENLSSRPTLNCEKGRTLTANITCLDATAAAADWDLISAYWARYFSLPQGERQDFEQAQQRWLQALNETCGNRPQSQQRQCVLLAYHSRAAGYRSQLNEDAIAESRLTPEQHAKIQRSLATFGLLDGTPNGEFGPNTRAAIKRFQAQSGSNEAIFLSPEQRAQLLRGIRLDQPKQQLPSRIDDKNPTDQSAPSQANNGATQSPVPTTKTQSRYSDAAGRRPQDRAEQVEATPQRAEANTRREKSDSTRGLAISLWQQVQGIPSWLFLALLAVTGVECFTSLIKGLAGKKVRDPAESVLNALKRQRWQGLLTLVLLGSSLLIAAIYSIAVATAMVAGGMWFIWIVLCRCNIDAELFADYARFETAALQLAKRYESTGGQPLLVKFVRHWRTLHGRLRFLVWSGRSAVVLITPACWWARFGTTYSMGDTKSICWNETKHTETITNPSALEEIVEETWEHATESGERDNQYKENRRVFVVQRYDIRLYLLNGGELVVRSMTPSGREAFLSALCEMIGNDWNTFSSEEGDADRAHESDHARYGNWGTHVDSRKWYEVLQVAETAEMEVIKMAYRRLVKGCHPDRIDKSLDVAFQDLANRKLQELNAAYEEAETLRGPTSNIPVPG
jgi:peptidoglycan hydrolase-like protein with peptidoglycan-binding domain